MTPSYAGGGDYSFVSPQPILLSRSQLAVLDKESGPEWSAPFGSTMANYQWITLTLVGNSSDTVTINNMVVHKSCQAPLTGTLFYSPPRGAGPFPVNTIGFDLDKMNPVGQFLPAEGGSGGAGGNFFMREVVTLKYGEPQTFGIEVKTYHYFCRFSFQLNIATDHGLVKERITNHGDLFSLTSDGEYPIGSVPFSSYKIVYAGGTADRYHNGKFIRVNPATYHGTGDPKRYPPTG